MRRRIAIDVKSEAIFNGTCDMYRTLLKRTWNPALPILVFCMLNPSTADVDFDDPTVAACQVRARLLGFGAVWIVNLFDFRATDPLAMKCVPNPSSEENNLVIMESLEACSMFICAWGTHGAHRDRGAGVKASLLGGRHAEKVHYLRLTKAGHPEHSLYIPMSVKPQRWAA